MSDVIELDRWQREIRDLVVEELKSLRKGDGVKQPKLLEQPTLMRLFDRNPKTALDYIRDWVAHPEHSERVKTSPQFDPTTNTHPDYTALENAYGLSKDNVWASDLTERREKLAGKIRTSTRTLISREDSGIKRMATDLIVQRGHKLNVQSQTTGGRSSKAAPSTASNRSSVDASKMSLVDALDAQSTVNRQISDANTELKTTLQKIEELKVQQAEIIKHLGDLQTQSALIQRRISEG